MANGINLQMGAKEWALLILLSVLWGGSFFFVAIAVKALPPLTVVWLRVGFAAITLLGVAAVMKQPMPRDLTLWRRFAVMGAINNLIPFTLIVWGQTVVASGVASILNATTPLFVVVLAHFLTRDEKLSWGRGAGVTFGVVGVLILVGPKLTTSHPTLGGNIWAELAILGAAISYAFAGIYGRRFAKLKVKPMLSAAGQLTASSLLLTPLVLWVDRPWTLPAPGVNEWAAVVGLACASTALAYVVYFRILATAGATNLLLVTLLIPVSAITLGAMVLSEQLALEHWMGMAAIALGLITLDGRLWDGRLWRHLRGPGTR